MIEYDPHHWLDHLFDIKGSMLRAISTRVVLIGLVAAAVVCVHVYVHPVGTPATFHSLVGIPLGMLLVFRTNQSYDRFWEGRKLWGGMVNETRNLARHAHAFLREAPDLQRLLLRLAAAFPYASMQLLRGAKDLGPGAHLMDGTDGFAAPPPSEHLPLWLMTNVAEVLRVARLRGVISDHVLQLMDHNAQQLVDYVGACERIHRTPLPFAYVVHLRRALLLYCLSLPFALVDTFGWWTIPDTLMLTYIFLGIEEIGVEIEDPFGTDDNDLPLEGICAGIERVVLGIRGPTPLA
jgi:putative membrane protein